MRRFLVLAPALLATTSCGLVLDFTPDGSESSAAGEAGAGGATTTTSTTASTGTGTGGDGAATQSSSASQGGGGGGGSGAGGGSPPGEGWAATIWSADAGAPTRARTLAVDGDTTWVAGHYGGTELRGRSPDGVEETIFGPDAGAPEVTSFILALDAAGRIIEQIPVASSTFGEQPADEFLGTAILPAGEGGLFLMTAHHNGDVLLEGVPSAEAASEGPGWNLVMARLDAEGAAVWAARCTANLAIDGSKDLPAHLSGVFGGLARVGEALLIGTTVSAATVVTCVTIVGDGEPCVADNLTGAGQSALVFSLDAATGDCPSAPAQLRSTVDNLWLDGLRAGGPEEIFVTGRVSMEGGTLEPWAANLVGQPTVAFLAPLGVDGLGEEDNVRTFATNGYPSVAAEGEIAAGSPRNEATASDVAIYGGSAEVWSFGDPGDRNRSEVVTSVSAEGGQVLLTGYMTEDASMADDLCGVGCQGDLSELDPCDGPEPSDEQAECPEAGDEVCDAPGIAERDAYWLLVEEGEEGPRAAVGRAFGACGNQSIVAGQLTAQALSLVVEMVGSATVDLLDEQVAVEIPEGRMGVAVVQVPRPPIQP